jgi:hypothetical protein
MNGLYTRVSAVVAEMTESPSHIVAVTCISGCAAGLTEFAIQTLLASLNVSRVAIHTQNSIVTGVVTAAFVWALLAMFSLRRRYLRTKLQVVADLNHELRNALEVIGQIGYLPEGQRHSALLDSADRINKALTELVLEMRATRPGSSAVILNGSRAGSTTQSKGTNRPAA